MAEPMDAQYEVYEALRRHFDRSDEKLSPEQISEMTGLDEKSVKDALRALRQADRINGIDVAEWTYPVFVTSINYD